MTFPHVEQFCSTSLVYHISVQSWHYPLAGSIRFHRLRGFSGGASGKEPASQCKKCKRCGFDPWVGKITWRRAWQPTPVFLPEESHEQRNLVGYNPWGGKESDTTEATKHKCPWLKDLVEQGCSYFRCESQVTRLSHVLLINWLKVEMTLLLVQ